MTKKGYVMQAQEVIIPGPHRTLSVKQLREAGEPLRRYAVFHYKWGQTTVIDDKWVHAAAEVFDPLDFELMLASLTRKPHRWEVSNRPLPLLIFKEAVREAYETITSVRQDHWKIKGRIVCAAVFASVYNSMDENNEIAEVSEPVPEEYLEEV